MILDASALLALLQNEPGAEKVASVIGQSKMSSVNWSEVIQKLARHDSEAATIRPLEMLKRFDDEAEIHKALEVYLEKKSA